MMRKHNRNLRNIKLLKLIFLSSFFLLILKSDYNTIKKAYSTLIPYTNSINNKPNNLKELFNKRRLYIPDANLTNEYIHYIRPINENNKEKI